jgi:hypothetical protein
VEEREDDVECKKWVLRVLRCVDHCTWSKHTKNEVFKTELNFKVTRISSLPNWVLTNSAREATLAASATSS